MPVKSMPKLNVNHRELIALPRAVTSVLVVTVSVLLPVMVLFRNGCQAAPSLAAKSWPAMKNYDIWGTPSEQVSRDADLSLSSSSSFSSAALPPPHSDRNLRNGTGFRRSRMFGVDGLLENDVFDLDQSNGFAAANRTSGRAAKGEY